MIERLNSLSQNTEINSILLNMILHNTEHITEEEIIKLTKYINKLESIIYGYME